MQTWNIAYTRPEHVDVLRDLFRWPERSTFVESVPLRAIVVRDALNAAIQLLGHWNPIVLLRSFVRTQLVQTVMTTY